MGNTSFPVHRIAGEGRTLLPNGQNHVIQPTPSKWERWVDVVSADIPEWQVFDAAFRLRWPRESSEGRSSG